MFTRWRVIIGVLTLVLVFVAGSVFGAMHGTFEGYPIVKMLVDGKEIDTDVPAVILEGRTLVPVRFVSEELGAEVDWDAEKYTVHIYSEEPKVVEPDEEYLQIELDRPLRWEHEDGLELVVFGLEFMPREWVEENKPDIAGFLDDDTNTLIVLDVWAKNTTGATISWYPDQGTLVVGPEQRDSSLFISDDVGDTSWHENVEKEGKIYWEFQRNVDELIEIGDARYIVGDAHDADHWDVRYGEQIDLEIKW